jgi:hypothetical protein
MAPNTGLAATLDDLEAGPDGEVGIRLRESWPAG